MKTRCWFGAAVVATAMLLVAGMAQPPWERMTEGERLAVRVGNPAPPPKQANDKCCSFGKATNCSWECTGPNPMCPADNKVTQGTCEDATCKTWKGFNCSGVEKANVRVPMCIRIGENTADGCPKIGDPPVQWKRCKYILFEVWFSTEEVEKQFCKDSSPEPLGEDACYWYSGELEEEEFERCVLEHVPPQTEAWCAQYVTNLPWQTGYYCSPGGW
jgi:hypothetical protein